MNLAARRSALLQNKVVMRLGVMLVITSMIVSWVALPKAKAVAVVDDVALGAAATAAYLTSTGIPLTVTAGGASAASAGIVAVAGEYAAATGAAASGEALLTTIAAGTALTTAGAVVLTAAAAAAVGALAYWVYQTYLDGVSDSVPVYNTTVFAGYLPCVEVHDSVNLYSNSSSYDTIHITSASAPVYMAEVYSNFADDSSLYCYAGVLFSVDDFVPVTKGWYQDTVYSRRKFGNYYVMSMGGSSRKHSMHGLFTCIGTLDSQRSNLDSLFQPLFAGSLESECLSVNNVGYSSIPEIAPAKQLELDIAAPPELELADLPEYTMNKVAAGDWSQPTNVPHSVTSADPDPVPDPDPDPDPADPGSGDPTVPPDTPDIDDLGLPDLGAALTTRFPFSIPWDIYRGLKLLSAPAVVPKFKVDFYRAIDTDLIDFGKGDTELVIDFGYYPEFYFIGELCRWTSTIGYCLFLASATKRFIWTA